MKNVETVNDMKQVITDQLEEARYMVKMNQDVIQRCGWVLAFTSNGGCLGIKLTEDKKVGFSGIPGQYEYEAACHNAKLIRNGHGHPTVMHVTDFYARRVEFLEETLKCFEDTIAAK